MHKAPKTGQYFVDVETALQHEISMVLDDAGGLVAAVAEQEYLSATHHCTANLPKIFSKCLSVSVILFKMTNKRTSILNFSYFS